MNASRRRNQNAHHFRHKNNCIFPIPVNQEKRMRSLANSPADSFETSNATKFLFCCVRHGLEWSDFKQPEIPHFSPLFDFQRLSHKMSPSYGLLHGWGFVFISPDSAVRPENPQTAACCSCVPSVSRDPSSFAGTLLPRGCPRRSRPAELHTPESALSGLQSASQRLRCPWQAGPFVPECQRWSQTDTQALPESQPVVPSGLDSIPLKGSPLPCQQKCPGWGYPQPGPKFSLLRNQE